MARQTFILRDGQLVEKKTGEVAVLRDGVQSPMVMRDIPEYTSPIDGKLITSRSHRREDLKVNNCIPWEESMSPTRGKFEFKNKKFAKKHNLPLGEQYR